MLMPAGYDRVSAAVKIVPGAIVLTSGLANCIAIAAYNKTSGLMVIAHFNTLFCYDQEAKKMDKAKLVNFKRWLGDSIKANAYAIGLGTLWINTAPGDGEIAYSNWDNLRFDLITKVKEVFHHEPTVAGKCIRFQLDSNGHALMEGSMSDAWINAMNWRDAGVEIPYATF